MSDLILSVDHVSKKYCRRLKKGMIYAAGDIARRLVGLPGQRQTLRPSEFWALEDVSFTLKRGEFMGLIGRNGAGKSTLLKLISGIVPPDSGNLRVSGRVGALIEIGAGFSPNLNGRENIYINGIILGMSKKEIDGRIDSIIDFSGLPSDALDAPLKTYSSGMYVRLGYAVAIHSEPDLFLIDEVLAVGDMNFQSKCLNALGDLRKKGTTVILTTHNNNIIANWSDHALALENGRVLAYGDPHETVQCYVEMMKAETGNPAKKAETENPAKNENRQINGTGRLRIEKITFRNNEGAETHPIRGGEPLCITAEIVSDAFIPDLEAEIYALDDQDRLVTDAYSLQLDGLLTVPSGKSVLIIDYPPVPLNGGELIWGLALWCGKRNELLDRLETDPIPITGNTSSDGSLWWYPRCSVQTPSMMNDSGSTISLMVERKPSPLTQDL